MGRRPLAFAVLGLMGAFLVLSAFLQSAHAPATSGAAPQGTSVAVGSATTGTTAPGSTTVAGGGNTQAGGAAPASGGAGTMIVATEKEYAIALDKASVPAGAVTFNVKNAGTLPHNLGITAADGASKQKGLTGKQLMVTPDIDGGKSATLTLDLAPGKYQIVCSVPGHIQLGMIIELTVT